MLNIKTTLLAAVLGVSALVMPAAAQEHHSTAPEKQTWSFAGPFGTYDQAQLQRGYRVYREVCSNCHSMKMVAFRNLSDPGGPGFTEAQVKALAAEYKVKDGPNDSGDMFDRPGRPSDYFPSPFPNEQAARAANGGALPPDMSVLAKARTFNPYDWFPADVLNAVVDVITQYQEQGPDYIVGIMNGYADAPKGLEMNGMNYNTIMPGNKIAMAKPLSDCLVDYTDGSPKTVLQYSRDVAAFLMWAAEPKLEDRKRTGFRTMIFLLVFAGLLYFVKKRIWAGVAH